MGDCEVARTFLPLKFGVVPIRYLLGGSAPDRIWGSKGRMTNLHLLKLAQVLFYVVIGFLDGRDLLSVFV